MNKPIKIGIYGVPLQASRTGVGRYVYEICRELDSILTGAHFFVYSNIPVELPFLSDRWIPRVDPSPLAKYLKPIAWLKLRCGRLCREDNIDVFWGTAAFLPVLPRKIRTVITVYDVNFKIVSETMPTGTLWASRLFYENDIKKAGSIVAISRGTAERIHGFWGCKADAIVYPAVGDLFKPQSRQRIQECLNKYEIKGPYILAVATWEPRKNLDLLLTAFIDMKNRGLLTGYKLVLAGGRGWKDKRLSLLTAKYGEADLLTLGYVPEEDLPALYSGADVFVFPSRYEGFGIPVLEARACGAKVVASDIPELREAGGADSIYIQPTIEGIKQGIMSALATSPDKNIDCVYHPTWKEGAAIYASLLCERGKK